MRALTASSNRKPVPEKEKDNPWICVSEAWGYMGITCSVEDRIFKIRQSTDVAWLERAVAWRDTQSTVKCAAETRLRVLARQKAPSGGAHRAGQTLLRGAGGQAAESLVWLVLALAGAAAIVLAFWN